ncbi:MAG: hypothetical protein HKN95_09270, partial [Acidimicrobiia bacterium]|nr:hypothetical protein [Acidimicrobiia bacterium]
PTAAPSPGSLTFDVASAGSLELTLDGGAPELVTAVPNVDWIVDEVETFGRELEVEFVNGTVEVKFKAELEDGVLKTEIEIEDESFDDDSDDDPDDSDDDLGDDSDDSDDDSADDSDGSDDSHDD